jgi:chromosome segregation ATPase
MTSLVSQHPWLWLVATYLSGFLTHWLIELFFLRQRLFEAESKLRRRNEELDSERFSHGRTTAESKARLEQLTSAQREIANLTRARDEARVQGAETEKLLASTRVGMTELESRLAFQERELETKTAELEGLRRQWEDSVRTRDEARLTAEKSTNALAHVRADVAALEGKLKARGEEIRQINESWGTAREEATELRERLAQQDARLDAAQQTRRTLEAELRERESELSELREKQTDLEAELRATSASHAQLETELARVQSLSGTSSSDTSSEALEQLRREVAEVTSERNRLAAELAALRSE